MPTTKRTRSTTKSMTNPKAKRMRSINCIGSETKTPLTDLHNDILLNILSKLSTNSLFSLRCVSKTQCSLVDSASFVDLHTPQKVMVLTESKLITMPALMKNGTLANNEFACDIPTSIGTGHNLKFVSNYGLLFFKEPESYGGRVVLLNPFRGEVLKLPPSTFDDDQYDWFGMGFDAVTSTHKIVRVSGPDMNHLVTEILVLGDSGSFSWRQIASFSPRFKLSNQICVSAYGNMHWLVSQRKMLLCFDFKKEAFKATPLPEMVKGRRRGHLINLKGSLAIVDVSLHLLSEKKQVNIWVMKSYETSEWERIYSIEIHTEVHWKTLIQLGACPGSVGVWDHGIFFKNVYSESQSIVFFLQLENGNTCIRALKAGSASIRNCGDGLAQVGFGVFSYSGSLISLRNICGSNLIEAAEKKCDFFCVAKMQRSILPRYAEEWQHCVLSSKLVQVGS